MGRDKGLLDFGGIPLILHTARLLDPLVAEVRVVGSPSRYASLGLHTISDMHHTQALNEPDILGIGPVAGIATALAATHSLWNLIVACDLPYLSAEWLDWLLSCALRSRGEVVIPRTERGIEPLAAVYRRECRAPIAAALARGVRKVSDAIAKLRVELVYPREWRRIEPSELILKNMNAPREWRRIEPSELILKNMNAPGDYEEARNWWTAERLSRNAHVRKPQLEPEAKRLSVPRRRK